MSLPNSAATYVRSASIRGAKFKRTLYGLQFIGTFLLYPGFFFYHFLVATGGVPPFLGGFYGVVTGLMLPVLILFFVYGVYRKHIRINRLDVVFFLLCLYCLLWACIYKVFGSDYQGGGDIFVHSISGVFIWMVNYILFRRVESIQRRGLLLLLLSGFWMLGVAWGNEVAGGYIARNFADLSVQDVIASYQGFARSAVVLLFILMAWVAKRWLMVVYYMGLVLLFLLSARSEFVGFFVVGFVIVTMRLGVRKYLLLASPVFIFGFFVLLDAAYDFGRSSRILGLMDLQADTSLANRMEMNSRALSSILEHPFIGDYGAYIVGGGIGDYAHNMLSAWVDFGLIGFIAFSYLLLSAIHISTGAVRRNAFDDKALIGFSFALFGLILAIFAKSMFFPLFAAGWGASAGLLESRTEQGNRRIQGA